ncbi:MAG: hypothetical protein P4L51_04915 [Puia sp.]|nr:hypothetical protein [Puia sp.]
MGDSIKKDLEPGNHLLRAWQPILVIFVIVNLFLLSSKVWLAQWKLDSVVIMIGNLILCAVTAFSFHLSIKALFHQNIQAFLRMVYSGMFLKMGVCVVSVLVWHFVDPGSIGRLSVMAFFALYLLYTFTEVALLMRLSKQKKNA